MKKNILFVFMIIIASACRLFSADPEITVQELEDHLNYLASEELAGRYPGTEGDRKTVDYIVQEFKRAGLTLLGDSGLQAFDVVTDIQLGEENALKWSDIEFVPETDFIPFSFSSNGSVEAPVVFAGYGFNFETDSLSWNDYASVDVKDKWVMMLRSNPDPKNTRSPYVNHSTDRGKALKAFDRGAAGVILVSTAEAGEEDNLVDLKKREHPLSLPAIHVKRELADRFLSPMGKTLDTLEMEMNTSKQPVSFVLDGILKASVDLQTQTSTTYNVAALLEGGHPDLKKEYVIVGAHHDHLGYGGPGSGSRVPDTTAIHCGADDNASGTAGVIELAEKIANDRPDRSVLFLTFGAEEMGMVGSRYLAENPLIDLDQVSLMVNLDMLGRLSTDRVLQIGGTGTAEAQEERLKRLNASYEFELKTSPEGFGPSDHSAFYAEDVPVLFISTGAHPDYHTPQDNVAGIRFEGYQQVLDFVSELVLEVANLDKKLVFQEAGPKVRMSSRSRMGKITLGLMPDVTYEGTEGMPVQFVTAGRPAAVSGMQKGDIIIAVDGKQVGNVYDYMSRLNELKEGQSVIVTVRRDGTAMDLLVQL